MSRSADAFIAWTASRSKLRSIRVRGVDGASRVVEYTTFSAACQIAA